jgi:hypothetical protein
MCVASAALSTYSSKLCLLPHCGRILKGNAWQVVLRFVSQRGNAVTKFVIAASAMLALVTAAAAADFPRRQPVYQEAPVGKMPVGKTPVGKTPVGKAPVAARY